MGDNSDEQSFLFSKSAGEAPTSSSNRASLNERMNEQADMNTPKLYAGFAENSTAFEENIRIVELDSNGFDQGDISEPLSNIADVEPQIVEQFGKADDSIHKTDENI
jgi:hypothetical protein